MRLTKDDGRIMEPQKKEEYAGKIQEGTDKGFVRKTNFPLKQVTIPIKVNYQKSEPPIKRLSDAELRSKLDKGLCFKCNERYTLGHRCRVKEKKELMLFIMNEEESKEDEGKTEENTGEVVELNHLDLA